MEANYVHKDSTTLVQDETGTYIEIPKNRITFKSKEAEIIFDLTLENDELRLKNQELKKQLKDKTEDYKRMKDNFDSKVDVLTKIEIQQKEFINYLEDEIKTLEKDILETVDDMDIYMKQVKSLIIEEILQKYEEIIGVSDENSKN